MPRCTFTSLDEVRAALGEEIGLSAPIVIEQGASTPSPTRPVTTNGSTSTSSAPTPDPSADRSPTGS